MCKYCEGKYKLGVVYYGEYNRQKAYIVGEWWGRGGWTRGALGHKWVSRSRIIQTADKRFRVQNWSEMTSPIEFCPKCGRKLS